MTTGIWINGIEQAAGARHLSAADRGLTLADGLFETMRARSGRIFRRDAHLARLTSGLATLAIPTPPHVHAWIDAALAACGAGDIRVRLTVTRGEGPPGLVPPADVRPTVIVATSPIADLSRAATPDPLALHVASGRRNERAMSVGLKTLSYTDGVLAMLEAQRHGADDALLLDTDGHCSETTACNLFICTPAGLVTPPVGCGALPGITRGVVIELAAAMGLSCDEHAFGLEALLGAEEAFLTNSTRGPAPVGRVGDRVLGGGVAGPRTRRLAEAWRATVLRECP